jgi:predicted metal-dependent hydrolase
MDRKVIVVRKSGNKRWRLSVNRDGEAVLSAPPSMSQEAIARTLEAHKHWIVTRSARRLASIEKARAIYAAHKGQIPLFGEWIAKPDAPIGFYRGEARVFFGEECAFFAATIGVRFVRIRIGDQKSRYGSCSAKGTLSFCARIVKAPRFVAKYIAAHEVSHLAYMNHKDRFWSCVASLAPDYLEAEKWLKENGDFLRLDPC